MIQVKDGFLRHTTIKGINISYYVYTSFIGQEILITAWQRVRINGKEIIPYFRSLHLTNYSQNLTLDWGQFKCKFNQLRNFDFHIDLIISFIYLFSNDYTGEQFKRKWQNRCEC